MGITANCSKFLFYAKDQGANFKNSLTLGRLKLFASKNEINEQAAFFKNAVRKVADVSFKDGYTDPLLEILGAERVDSLDYSDYEKATIIHDMNLPIDPTLKNRFSVIIDGGTIEHVFNFPVAIKNCMEMLALGGHYISITPANNLMGHGFYQFSPELYYRTFSEENGFETTKIIICTQTNKNQFSDWYEVIDPKKIQKRVMFVNDTPAYLMVLAKKIAQKPVFEKMPQQSDYEVLWEKMRSLDENRPAEKESRMIFLYRKLVPRPLKALIYKLRLKLGQRRTIEKGLGIINARQFKMIELKPKNS